MLAVRLRSVAQVSSAGRAQGIFRRSRIQGFSTRPPRPPSAPATGPGGKPLPGTSPLPPSKGTVPPSSSTSAANRTTITIDPNESIISMREILAFVGILAPATLFVTYAKVPAVRNYFEERDVHLPDAVREMYKFVGLDVPEPAATHSMPSFKKAPTKTGITQPVDSSSNHALKTMQEAADKSAAQSNEAKDAPIRSAAAPTPDTKRAAVPATATIAEQPGSSKASAISRDKEKVSAAAAAASNKASDAASTAADKTKAAASTAVDRTKSSAAAAADKTKSAVNTAAEKGKSAASTVADKAKSAADTTAEKASSAASTAADKAKEAAAKTESTAAAAAQKVKPGDSSSSSSSSRSSGSGSGSVDASKGAASRTSDKSATDAASAASAKAQEQKHAAAAAAAAKAEKVKAEQAGKEKASDAKAHHAAASVHGDKGSGKDSASEQGFKAGAAAAAAAGGTSSSSDVGNDVTDTPSGPSAQELRAHKLKLDTLNKASEEIAEASAALKKDLEAGILGDLDQLDAQALRFRIVQLAAEMQDRIKWEALRLQQSLKATEEEAARRYIPLITQQKEEAEAHLKHELSAQKEQLREAITKEYEGKVHELLQQQNDSFEKVMQAQLDQQRFAITKQFNEQLDNAVLEAKKATAELSDERRKELQQAKHQVQAVQSAWDSLGDVERASLKAHRLTAATLALSQQLATSEPAGPQLSALLSLIQSADKNSSSSSSGGNLAAAAVAALPAAAAAQGIPTAEALRARFSRVRAECLRAALIPEGSSGVAGQVLGTALAALTLQRKGMVQGDAADDVLARADYLVGRGELGSAVRELKALKGLPAVTVQDWLSDAEARLLTDQAVKALQAHVTLVNVSLINVPSS